MVLCTVGTHEDPFNRLVQALDELKLAGLIEDEVVIQSGWSTYPARACRLHEQLPFDELQSLMADARIVITHGGPASIMQALAHGKVPVVVPRQSGFGEHVDDHQVRFAQRLSDRVLVVIDIAELEAVLAGHAVLAAGLPANEGGRQRAVAFAEKLDVLCETLLG